MPYRDELDALRIREAALGQELDETRRMREAVEKRALPMLDRLRVASPCPENWDDMIGDERARFCGRCAKEVYDISAMSRVEAARFLAEQEHGSVCVTFRRRKDGKIMTSDCDVGARRRRFGIGVVALAAIGAVGAFALDLDARGVGAAREAQQAPHMSAHDDEGQDRITGVRSAGDESYGRATTAPQRRSSGGPSVSPQRKSAPRTTGCACMAGDPLCSCL